MEDLVDKGLVRSIGVSNFSPEKIQGIIETARIVPAINQVSLAHSSLPYVRIQPH